MRRLFKALLVAFILIIFTALPVAADFVDITNTGAITSSRTMWKIFGGAGYHQWGQGQTFTPVQNDVISQFDVEMKITLGAPTVNWRGYITTTSGGELQQNYLGTSTNVIASSNISSSAWNMYSFTFTGVSVNASTLYGIFVYPTTDMVNDTQAVDLAVADASYAGGNTDGMRNDGVTQAGADDLWFRIWGSAGTLAASVTTLPATLITMDKDGVTGGNFTANLTSLGSATSANVSFEYGLTTSYGASTANASYTTLGVKTANTPTNLIPGSTYHYRANADNGYGMFSGSDVTFTYTMPSIATGPATNLTFGGGQSFGNFTATISAMNTASSTYGRFLYGENTSYESSTANVTYSVAQNVSVSVPNNLSSNVTYHFMFQVQNGITTANGTDMVFSYTLPTVLTLASTNISMDKDGNAYVLFNATASLGSSTNSTLHFHYGLDTTYGSFSDNLTITNNGTYSIPISTSLLAGNTYHVEAMLDHGTSSNVTGGDQTFILTMPIVSTASAAAISMDKDGVTSGFFRGVVTSLSTANNTYLYALYGTTMAYGSTSSTTVVSSPGTYSIAIPAGLVPGQTYHYQIQAQNGANVTNAADDESFVFTLPTVSTSGVINTFVDAGTNAGTLVGDLTSGGVASSVYVYFQYGSNTTYGTNTTLQAVAVLGSFTANITGAPLGTTHFRAVVRVGGVNVVGADSSFTLPGGSAPSVTTNAATYVAFQNARLNGTVVNDGGSSVSIRFQYYTGGSVNWTQNETPWVAGYITGDHVYANVSSLTSNTTYTYRVQMDTGVIVASGSSVNFTTAVVTDAPTNFQAYPGSTSIILTWTPGLGSAQTLIRFSESGFPTTTIDGTQIYQNVAATYTHTGLLPGHTYYYSAWGISGNATSVAHAIVMGTTVAASTSPTAPPAMPNPTGWFQTPDYTNFSNLPIIYDLNNAWADAFQIPRNSYWFFVTLFWAVVWSLLVLLLSRHLFPTMVFLAVFIAICSLVKLLPMFMVGFSLVIGFAGYQMREREGVE